MSPKTLVNGESWPQDYYRKSSGYWGSGFKPRWYQQLCDLGQVTSLCCASPHRVVWLWGINEWIYATHFKQYLTCNKGSRSSDSCYLTGPLPSGTVSTITRHQARERRGLCWAVLPLLRSPSKTTPPFSNWQQTPDKADRLRGKN